ncbi:MAG: hypothetical protein ALAOOOJD_02414 [bacterium]|nr:hypothetical protein [bacterium]
MQATFSDDSQHYSRSFIDLALLPGSNINEREKGVEGEEKKSVFLGVVGMR